MKKHFYSSGLKNARTLAMAALSLGLMFTSFKAQAQYTVTVGNGTGTTGNIPLSTSNAYNYTQNIYLATELTAGGAASGTINKISFYYAGTAQLVNSNDWTIYMGLTTKTDFTSTTDWVPTTSLTAVYSGTVTYPSGGGWLEVTLNTPFNYAAGSNLVVALDENSAGTDAANNWRHTTTTPYRGIYYRNASTNPNPASPPTATGRVQGYSNVLFDMTLTPCSGAPAPGNAIASTTLACGPLTTSTLSIQNPYANVPGITYQWQSNNGSGFTSIPTATNSTYVATGVTGVINYQAVLTCSASASGTSTPVTVTVNPLPTLSVSPAASNAICTGGSTTLTVSGAANYTWSPATALSATNTASVVASPTTSVMYTITGVDANNCTNTLTTTVAPIAKIVASASFSAAATCTAGNPVPIQINASLPASSPGTWEYEFMNNNTSVLQPWGASNMYTFTPTASGDYHLKGLLRNTGCAGETSDTVRIDIGAIGFGARIDTIQINCKRPTGSLILSNIYGQAPWDTLLMTDFTNTLTAAQGFISGNASYTAGRLVLTPSATSNKGALTLLNPNSLNPQNAAYEISFNMTNDQPINIYGTGGADGLAWSFGDDAIYNSGSAVAMSGFGTKLRISFDAADNSPNSRGIYLLYGYTSTTTQPPATVGSGVLAYSSDLASWKLQTDVPVSIKITEAGKLTLTVGSTVIWNNFQLPAAFVTANKSNWNHVFSAATGGDAMRQAIDNLKIRYRYRLEYGVAPGNSGTMPTTWQSTPNFTGLAAGLYDVWMVNSLNHNCAGFLGTHQVKNINPVVRLGNDTAICAGAQLVLNAGNPTALSYNWSNGLGTARTATVTNSGTYMVEVIDTANCHATGIITVSQAALPTGVSIYSTISGNNGLTYLYSVVSPQNVNSYTWNFGDGSTQPNGPSTVAHTYTANGTYTVTAVLANNNGCGTTTLTTVVNVINTVGVEELGVSSSLSVFPNPASNMVTINSGDNQVITGVAVYDMTGKLVQQLKASEANVSLDLSAYGNGVYTLQITTDKGQGHKRLIVTKQ